MEKIIAACGNDCAACPRYIRHPYEKTPEQLQRTAELWYKIGYRDHVVTNEEISCTGCKAENWCRYKANRCCFERKIRTCGECGEYPCETMKDCFKVTMSFEPACREACTTEEYEQMRKAFFEKEKNLADSSRNSSRFYFETERLIMRPMVPDDAEAAFRWCGDPKVNTYMIYPLYHRVEDVRTWIESIQPGGKNYRADNIIEGIVLKSTSELIGSGGMNYVPEEDAWEIGYNLRADQWGHGYAVEFLWGLINEVRKYRPVPAITGEYAKANHKSQRVMEKMGMTYVKDTEYERLDGSEVFPARQYRRDFVFYHVISDVPKQVGEHVILDEDHPNGVHQRVYEQLETVKDIYAHPEKYEGTEFSHDVKVALRELALEKVRKEKYPNYPSRMASLYVSRTFKEAEQWGDYFVSLGRPTYGIAKIEARGNCYVGDAYKCFDGTSSEEENLRQAQIYWENGPNADGKDRIVEILVDGDIEILEIPKVYKKDEEQ